MNKEPSSKEKFFVISEIIRINEPEDNVVSTVDFPRLPKVLRFEDYDINPENLRLYLQKLDKEGILQLGFDSENDFYGVSVYDTEKLILKYRFHSVARLHDDGVPALYSYNPFSGKGVINGKTFKLKNSNKKIFNILVSNYNEDVDKNTIWRAAGNPIGYRSGKHTDSPEFNQIITNLRKVLGGVSSKQLRLKKKVKLWGFNESIGGVVPKIEE